MPSLAFISNLAGPQGLMIMLVVILLFGAKRLPELGRSLGETMREFSRGKHDEDEDPKKSPPKE